MYIIYDHLIAVLIAGFIFLILVQVKMQGQETQVESVRFYAGHKHMINFVDTIKRDFQNIGSGLNFDDQMIVSYTWDETEKSFAFLGRVDTTAGASVELIKYQLVEIPSNSSNCGTEQCYEVQRLVHDGISYQLAGKSAESITGFEIQLYKGNGSPVGADLDETRQIFVQVAGISPLGQDDIIQKSRWQSRLYPANLTLKDQG